MQGLAIRRPAHVTALGNHAILAHWCAALPAGVAVAARWCRATDYAFVAGLRIAGEVDRAAARAVAEHGLDHHAVGLQSVLWTLCARVAADADELLTDAPGVEHI